MERFVKTTHRAATILPMAPLLGIVSGFSLGIALRSLFVFGWPVLLFLLIPATLSALGYWLKGRPLYLVALLFCIFTFFGMLRASAADTPLPDAFLSALGSRVTYEGIVARDPDIREKTQRVTIRISEEDTDVLMLAVAPHQPRVWVGERVRVSGTLALPEPFATDGGRTFRYDKYLEKDGVRFLLNFARLYPLEPAPWYSVPALLARVKHAFLDGLKAALPPEHAALAGGIMIGGRTGFSTALREAFITSGLVHLIVLSGYNVMIVAEWMMALLALMTRSKRIQAIAGAGALLLFVGIAGFSSAATRATVMALIALYARASAKTYAASRALLAAILVMLLWNPLFLLYDPGFGLSITATAGLIWLAPRFETSLLKARAWLGRGTPRPLQHFWIQATATTLAAQAGVLPLLLYNTGNLSIVALPANLLVIAVMPLTMGAAAIAAFGGVLFGSTVPLLALVLGVPAHLLTGYVLFVAIKSAALPGAALILPAFSFGWVVLAYALIVFVASSKRFSTTDQFTFAKNAST